MTLRFPALALALAFAAGCGGQIDTSVFETNGDSSTVADSSTIDDSSTTSDTSTPPPGPDALPAQEAAPPPGTGTTGTPCTSSSECAGGVCFHQRCTTSCSRTSDCIAGWYCSSQAQGKICACFPSGPDCGGQDKNCDGVISSYAPCTTDAGVPPPPPPPSDSGTTLSCVSCAQSSCATETNDCYNDPVCRQFLNCIQPCATIPSTCVTQCENNHKDPTTQAWVDCMSTNCGGCQ